MSLTAGTYAVFNTTEGKITVRLFEADAPITVKNFVELAEGSREWVHPITRAKSSDKLYDGTIFHRVIPDFMIQGGDPAGSGMGGPGYRFQDETKGSPAQVRQAWQTRHGELRPGHKRQPVLPHRCAHRLAHRQPHHLRRSGRGAGHRDKDLKGRAQLDGQAAQARRGRIACHRARLACIFPVPRSKL
jgi:cyclophilin family peptidyl-prolyl cis-trans isomerase